MQDGGRELFEESRYFLSNRCIGQLVKANQFSIESAPLVFWLFYGRSVLYVCIWRRLHRRERYRRRIHLSVEIRGREFHQEAHWTGYTVDGERGPEHKWISILQIFICTAKTAWLDGKHVLFEQVVEGFDVVKAVEKVGSSSGRTAKPVVIADCGQLS
ncbi:hypothetical protein Pfo_017068 [Paulownia fortunei]|nr:hypothetical protein Pfo_017068 [Paulownia fortunei]